MSDVYRCANCGVEGERDDFAPAADLYERLEPGGLYSDVECRSCGALAFPIPAEPAEKPGDELARLLSPESIEMAVSAVRGAYTGIEERAIHFLLDGLGVPDLRTLHQLVAGGALLGRVVEDSMGSVIQDADDPEGTWRVLIEGGWLHLDAEEAALVRELARA